MGLLRGGAVALLLWSLPINASAQQAASCRVPDPMPVPRPIPIPRGEAVQAPQRGGFILSLSWSPQYCAAIRDPAGERNRDQCAVPEPSAFWARSRSTNAPYAWILHGLWPQAAQGESPRWCRLVRIVPKDVLRRNFCVSPSVHLMQHQWAKHGSCMSADPATYFQRGSNLFRTMGFPDMALLSHRRQNSVSIRRAFSRSNRGTSEHMFTVHTDRDGWLREVRLCLNSQMRPAVCRPNQQGLVGPREVRIRPAKS